MRVTLGPLITVGSASLAAFLESSRFRLTDFGRGSVFQDSTVSRNRDFAVFRRAQRFPFQMRHQRLSIRPWPLVVPVARRTVPEKPKKANLPRGQGFPFQMRHQCVSCRP